MYPSPATLRFASVLSHSDNRRICGFAFGYAQICLSGKLHISPERSYVLNSWWVAK